MTRMLDDDEAAPHIVGIRSQTGAVQNREVTIISESGLYACILKSRRPDAQRFRKWVTAEVLPAIRQTGHYGRSRELELITVDSQGGERVSHRYYSVKGQGLHSDPATGPAPTLLMHQQAIDLLSAGSKMLEIATSLLQGHHRDSPYPMQTHANYRGILGGSPPPTLDQDAITYQRIIAAVYEILANEAPPHGGKGWTVSAIERTYGGIDQRLKIGQKTLRKIIDQALERGDLHRLPGRCRGGKGYLTSIKPDTSQTRPNPKRNGLAG